MILPDNSGVDSKSDIWREKKLRAIFTSLDSQEPPFAFWPPLPPPLPPSFASIVHQIPGDQGGARPLFPFPPCLALFSAHPSRSLFRIISFESTIMGCREHAGHVFAKVCAPNTKAAWQTGSIPRVAGRRYTTTAVLDCDIHPVCPLVGRPVVLPSFLRLLSRRGYKGVGGPTPYVVKDEGIS